MIGNQKIPLRTARSMFYFSIERGRCAWSGPGRMRLLASRSLLWNIMLKVSGATCFVYVANLLIATGPRADTCAPSPVSARGEESRFEWTAKAKTRANWRAKVRAIPSLGPDYANWARAENTEERCLSGPNGTVCTFTGTPCRP